MQDPKIIPATAADYAELILVWEASVRATHDFLTETDILTYKQLILEQYFDQLSLYCIKENSGITGFIGVDNEFLQMLFIHPSKRGTGLGKALIRYATSNLSVTKVDVNEQNLQAVGFYHHLGFEAVEWFDHDAAGKPYPIVSMSL